MATGRWSPWVLVSVLIASALASAVWSGTSSHSPVTPATLPALSTSNRHPQVSVAAAGASDLPSVTSTSVTTTTTDAPPAPVVVSPATVAKTDVTTTTVVPAPAPTTPTTTTQPPPPACQGGQFVALLVTAGTTFSVGAAIDMTLTITNNGPTCTGVVGGCPGGTAAAFGTIDGQYQEVWRSYASADPVPVTCVGATDGPIPSGWTQSQAFSWSQGLCQVSGSQCTEAQVPVGTYLIQGMWAEFGAASNETVTITS